MKNAALIILTFLFVEFTFSQCPIVPAPKNFVLLKGRYRIEDQLLIDSNAYSESNWIYLKENFFKQTGLEVKHFSNQKSHELDPIPATKFGNLYHIRISPESVYLAFESKEAQFYAINSLLQLLRKDEDGWYLMNCSFSDSPDFQWRGLHLDVSRHFYTVER